MPDRDLQTCYLEYPKMWVTVCVCMCVSDSNTHVVHADCYERIADTDTEGQIMEVQINRSSFHISLN